ncbi:MAG: DUF1214 domain-containing protein [Bradyrhizobiaceae bacterium]|nr:DUF1214 domain-containing protein [Bradyrhizobiaceae bacterium]
MRVIVVLIALVVGTVSGLGLTWLASARSNGFGAVQVGAWTAWPRSGTDEADPYARAVFARSGQLPIERADGLVFEATTTDNGHSIDGRCETRIAGRLPAARFWTLTAYDTRGRLIDNPAERYGFNSTEIVWNHDGSFEITAAPRARRGNWLPTGDRDRIVFRLRLYDAPIGLASRSGQPLEMPSVTQVNCP